MRNFIISSIFMAACASSSDDTSVSEPVVAECDYLITRGSFVIATVADPTAVTSWEVKISEPLGWSENDEAAWLTDRGQFLLTNAEYCPVGETLTLTWWLK